MDVQELLYSLKLQIDGKSSVELEKINNLLAEVLRRLNESGGVAFADNLNKELKKVKISELKKDIQSGVEAIESSLSKLGKSSTTKSIQTELNKIKESFTALGASRSTDSFKKLYDDLDKLNARLVEFRRSSGKLGQEFSAKDIQSGSLVDYRNLLEEIQSVMSKTTRVGGEAFSFLRKQANDLSKELKLTVKQVDAASAGFKTLDGISKNIDLAKFAIQGADINSEEFKDLAKVVVNLSSTLKQLDLQMKALGSNEGSFNYFSNLAKAQKELVGNLDLADEATKTQVRQLGLLEQAADEAAKKLKLFSFDPQSVGYAKELLKNLEQAFNVLSQGSEEGKAQAAVLKTAIGELKREVNNLGASSGSIRQLGNTLAEIDAQINKSLASGDTGAASKLEASYESANAALQKLIKSLSTLSGIQAQLGSANTELNQAGFGSESFNDAIKDVTLYEGKLRDLSYEINRLKALSSTPIQGPVDEDGFGQELTRSLQSLKLEIDRLTSKKFAVDIDSAQAIEELANVQREINVLSKELDTKIAKSMIEAFDLGSLEQFEAKLGLLQKELKETSNVASLSFNTDLAKEIGELERNISVFNLIQKEAKQVEGSINSISASVSLLSEKLSNTTALKEGLSFLSIADTSDLTREFRNLAQELGNVERQGRQLSDLTAIVKAVDGSIEQLNAEAARLQNIISKDLDLFNPNDLRFAQVYAKQINSITLEVERLNAKVNSSINSGVDMADSFAEIQRKIAAANNTIQVTIPGSNEYQDAIKAVGEYEKRIQELNLELERLKSFSGTSLFTSSSGVTKTASSIQAEIERLNTQRVNLDIDDTKFRDTYSDITKKINELANLLNNEIAEAVEKSFPIFSLERYEAQLNNLNNKLKESAKIISTGGNNKLFVFDENIAAEIGDLERAVKTLGLLQDEAKQVEGSINGVNASLARLTDELNNIRVKDSAGNLTAEFQDVASKIGEASRQARSFQDNLQVGSAVENSFTSLRAEITRLQNVIAQDLNLLDGQDLSLAREYTQRIKELEVEIARLQRSIDGPALLGKSDIPKTTAELREYIRRLTEARDVTQVYTKEWRNINAQIERSNLALQRYENNVNNAGNATQSLSQRFTNIARNLVFAFSVARLVDVVKQSVTDILTLGREYERQMSVVGALTGATTEQFNILNEATRALGRNTIFTATEAAKAAEILALAGFNFQEILQAQAGLLDLAAGGGLSLEKAADIAAVTIRSYGFAASEISRVNDVLSNSLVNFNLNLESFYEASKLFSPVAKAIGLEFEESAALIDALANAGFRGSIAGTALRAAVVNLTKPSDKAKKVIADLGVTIFDANGNVRNFIDLLDDLGKANLNTEQLSRIFGKQITAISLLLATGAETIRDYVAQVGELGNVQRGGRIIFENATIPIREYRLALGEATTSVDGQRTAIEGVKLALDQADISYREAGILLNGLVKVQSEFGISSQTLEKNFAKNQKSFANFVKVLGDRKTREAFKELGLNITDVSGNLLDIPTVIRELQRAINDPNVEGSFKEVLKLQLQRLEIEPEEPIFIRAKDGVEFDTSIADPLKDIYNSIQSIGSLDNLDELSVQMQLFGTTAEIAAAKVNNLDGDIKILDSAKEDLFLTIYTYLVPAFRSVAKELTKSINSWSATIQRAGSLREGLYDLSRVLGILYDLLNLFIKVLPAFASIFATAILPIAGVTGGIAKMIIALKKAEQGVGLLQIVWTKFTAFFVANPFGAIITVLTIVTGAVLALKEAFFSADTSAQKLQKTLKDFENRQVNLATALDREAFKIEELVNSENVELAADAVKKFLATYAQELQKFNASFAAESGGKTVEDYLIEPLNEGQIDLFRERYEQISNIIKKGNSDIISATESGALRASARQITLTITDLANQNKIDLEAITKEAELYVKEYEEQLARVTKGRAEADKNKFNFKNIVGTLLLPGGTQKLTTAGAQNIVQGLDEALVGNLVDGLDLEKIQKKLTELSKTIQETGKVPEEVQKQITKLLAQKIILERQAKLVVQGANETLDAVNKTNVTAKVNEALNNSLVIAENTKRSTDQLKEFRDYLVQVKSLDVDSADKKAKAIADLINRLNIDPFLLPASATDEDKLKYFEELIKQLPNIEADAAQFVKLYQEELTKVRAKLDEAENKLTEVKTGDFYTKFFTNRFTPTPKELNQQAKVLATSIAKTEQEALRQAAERMGPEYKKYFDDLLKLDIGSRGILNINAPTGEPSDPVEPVDTGKGRLAERIKDLIIQSNAELETRRRLSTRSLEVIRKIQEQELTLRDEFTDLSILQQSALLNKLNDQFISQTVDLLEKQSNEVTLRYERLFKKVTDLQTEFASQQRTIATQALSLNTILLNSNNLSSDDFINQNRKLNESLLKEEIKFLTVTRPAKLVEAIAIEYNLQEEKNKRILELFAQERQRELDLYEKDSDKYLKVVRLYAAKELQLRQTLADDLRSVKLSDIDFTNDLARTIGDFESQYKEFSDKLLGTTRLASQQAIDNVNNLIRSYLPDERFFATKEFTAFFNNIRVESETEFNKNLDAQTKYYEQLTQLTSSKEQALFLLRIGSLQENSKAVVEQFRQDFDEIIRDSQFISTQQTAELQNYFSSQTKKSKTTTDYYGFVIDLVQKGTALFSEVYKDSADKIRLLVDQYTERIISGSKLTATQYRLLVEEELRLLNNRNDQLTYEFEKSAKTTDQFVQLNQKLSDSYEEYVKNLSKLQNLSVSVQGIDTKKLTDSFEELTKQFESGLIKSAGIDEAINSFLNATGVAFVEAQQDLGLGFFREKQTELLANLSEEIKRVTEEYEKLNSATTRNPEEIEKSLNSLEELNKKYAELSRPLSDLIFEQSSDFDMFKNTILSNDYNVNVIGDNVSKIKKAFQSLLTIPTIQVAEGTILDPNAMTVYDEDAIRDYIESIYGALNEINKNNFITLNSTIENYDELISAIPKTSKDVLTDLLRQYNNDTEKINEFVNGVISSVESSGGSTLNSFTKLSESIFNGYKKVKEVIDSGNDDISQLPEQVKLQVQKIFDLLVEGQIAVQAGLGPGDVPTFSFIDYLNTLLYGESTITTASANSINSVLKAINTIDGAFRFYENFVNKYGEQLNTLRPQFEKYIADFPTVEDFLLDAITKGDLELFKKRYKEIATVKFKRIPEDIVQEYSELFNSIKQRALDIDTGYAEIFDSLYSMPTKIRNAYTKILTELRQGKRSEEEFLADVSKIQLSLATDPAQVVTDALNKLNLESFNKDVFESAIRDAFTGIPGEIADQFSDIINEYKKGISILNGEISLNPVNIDELLSGLDATQQFDLRTYFNGLEESVIKLKAFYKQVSQVFPSLGQDIKDNFQSLIDSYAKGLITPEVFTSEVTKLTESIKTETNDALTNLVILYQQGKIDASKFVSEYNNILNKLPESVRNQVNAIKLEFDSNIISTEEYTNKLRSLLQKANISFIEQDTNDAIAKLNVQRSVIKNILDSLLSEYTSDADKYNIINKVFLDIDQENFNEKISELSNVLDQSQIDRIVTEYRSNLITELSKSNFADQLTTLFRTVFSKSLGSSLSSVDVSEFEGGVVNLAKKFQDTRYLPDLTQEIASRFQDNLFSLSFTGELDIDGFKAGVNALYNSIDEYTINLKVAAAKAEGSYDELFGSLPASYVERLKTMSKDSGPAIQELISIASSVVDNSIEDTIARIDLISNILTNQAKVNVQTMGGSVDEQKRILDQLTNEIQAERIERIEAALGQRTIAIEEEKNRSIAKLSQDRVNGINVTYDQIVEIENEAYRKQKQLTDARIDLIRQEALQRTIIVAGELATAQASLQSAEVAFKNAKDILATIPEGQDKTQAEANVAQQGAILKAAQNNFLNLKDEFEKLQGQTQSEILRVSREFQNEYISNVLATFDAIDEQVQRINNDIREAELAALQARTDGASDDVLKRLDANIKKLIEDRTKIITSANTTLLKGIVDAEKLAIQQIQETYQNAIKDADDGIRDFIFSVELYANVIGQLEENIGASVISSNIEFNKRIRELNVESTKILAEIAANDKKIAVFKDSVGKYTLQIAKLQELQDKGITTDDGGAIANQIEDLENKIDSANKEVENITESTTDLNKSLNEIGEKGKQLELENYTDLIKQSLQIAGSVVNEITALEIDRSRQRIEQYEAEYNKRIELIQRESDERLKAIDLIKSQEEVDAEVANLQTIEGKRDELRRRENESRESEIDAETKRKEALVAIEEDRIRRMTTLQQSFNAAIQVANLALSISNSIPAITKLFAEGGIAGFALVPAMIATIVAAVASITRLARAPRQYEEGGRVLRDGDNIKSGGKIKGKRHKQGGVFLEGEGDEFVVNREGYAMFPDIIEYINELGLKKKRGFSVSIPESLVKVSYDVPKVPAPKRVETSVFKAATGGRIVVPNTDNIGSQQIERLQLTMQEVSNNIITLSQKIQDQRLVLSMNELKREQDKQVTVKEKISL